MLVPQSVLPLAPPPMIAPPILPGPIDAWLEFDPDVTRTPGRRLWSRAISLELLLPTAVLPVPLPWYPPMGTPPAFVDDMPPPPPIIRPPLGAPGAFARPPIAPGPELEGPPMGIGAGADEGIGAAEDEPRREGVSLSDPDPVGS